MLKCSFINRWFDWSLEFLLIFGHKSNEHNVCIIQWIGKNQCCLVSTWKSVSSGCSARIHQPLEGKSLDIHTVSEDEYWPIGPVWSKMSTFHMSSLLFKSTVMLLSTRYVLTIYETFKMRYCMKFYLKGHQNYSMSKSKVAKKTYFIK